jgi:hypothetical protein
VRAVLLRYSAVCGLTSVLLLAGCAGQPTTFVSEGGSYDASSAVDRAEDADLGSLAKEPSDRASDLRRRALVSLRKQGDEQQRAAELITRTFPAETRAVPFYIERASYENTPGYLIVEALGRPDETLSRKRLWIIDEKGEVLLSVSR